MVVSPGVSRRSLIKNLVENYGVSSIRLDLDYGELLTTVADIGFVVKEVTEPSLFYVEQYPLKRICQKAGKCLAAYDSGQIIITKDN